MRVGIFGGTFDPPHVGHLIAASDACDALSLDQVVFVPAATQPLKAGIQTAPAGDRLAMVRLLTAGDMRFSVDPMEVDRGGLSFMVDTLRALRQRWPAGTADLVVLLGADAAAQFPLWKDPAAIQALAEVVVLTRGEAPLAVPGKLREIGTRRVDVSSTEIRERVKAGKPVRALVTDPVAAYIARSGLYR
jgi:nicotinate-nucleotide adenylyltransferase